MGPPWQTRDGKLGNWNCRFSIADCRYAKLETGNLKLGKQRCPVQANFDFPLPQSSIDNRQ
jgi:hypothetical protein